MKEKKEGKSNKYIIFIIIGILIVIGSFFLYNMIVKKNDEKSKNHYNVLITAHRGSSLEYPENTMLAFEKAKELGADIIELDVRETLDGKLIVMHDRSFKRIANLDKKVWKLTYEEIEKLDVGSYKNEQFSDVRIATFEEVVAWASKNNVRLNVELKPNGHEENFEGRVLSLLENYHLLDTCVVASSNYESVEKVKEINSKVKTVYVMSSVTDNVLDYDKADCYSIEESYITKELVDAIHQNKKEIYAWTLDTEEVLNKMIDLNVDSVITDDILLAKEVLAKK